MIEKAKNFLQNNLENIGDAYTVSIVSYALHLLKNPNASNRVNGNHVISTRFENEGNERQNSPSSGMPSPFDWLYDKDGRPTDDEQLNTTKSENHSKLFKNTYITSRYLSIFQF